MILHRLPDYFETCGVHRSMREDIDLRGSYPEAVKLTLLAVRSDEKELHAICRVHCLFESK